MVHLPLTDFVAPPQFVSHHFVLIDERGSSNTESDDSAIEPDPPSKTWKRLRQKSSSSDDDEPPPKRKQVRSRKAKAEAEARVQEDTMASTHDVPNGSTPAELSEPGELNMSPSDLRSLVNRKRLRQYPSSKDDSEEPEPPENFSDDPEPPENFSDDVDEPPKKRRNKQRFSSEEINMIASVTQDTVPNSGQAVGIVDNSRQSSSLRKTAGLFDDLFHRGHRQIGQAKRCIRHPRAG